MLHGRCSRGPAAPARAGASCSQRPADAPPSWPRHRPGRVAGGLATARRRAGFFRTAVARRLAQVRVGSTDHGAGFLLHLGARAARSPRLRPLRAAVAGFAARRVAAFRRAPRLAPDLATRAIGRTPRRRCPAAGDLAFGGAAGLYRGTCAGGDLGTRRRRRRLRRRRAGQRRHCGQHDDQRVARRLLLCTPARIRQGRGVVSTGADAAPCHARRGGPVRYCKDSRQRTATRHGAGGRAAVGRADPALSALPLPSVSLSVSVSVSGLGSEGAFPAILFT